MYVLYTSFDAFKPELLNAHQYALFAFQTQECRDETRRIADFLPNSAVVVKNCPQNDPPPPKKSDSLAFWAPEKISKSRTDVLYTSFDASRTQLSNGRS